MDFHAGEAGDLFFLFPLGGLRELDVLSVLVICDFPELNPAGGRVEESSFCRWSGQCWERECKGELSTDFWGLVSA